MLILGISLLVKPEIIFGFIENNMGDTSLYMFAIVVRLVLGILFIAAATESRFPGVIKILGYLFILAAIILVILSQDGFLEFMTPIIQDVKPFARLGGLLGIAFGGFLFYAFSSNKELGRI